MSENKKPVELILYALGIIFAAVVYYGIKYGCPFLALSGIVYLICWLGGWTFSFAIPGIILLIAIILRFIKVIVCEE